MGSRSGSTSSSRSSGASSGDSRGASANAHACNNGRVLLHEGVATWPLNPKALSSEPQP